jgi:hypothetical protein
VRSEVPVGRSNGNLTAQSVPDGKESFVLRAHGLRFEPKLKSSTSHQSALQQFRETGSQLLFAGDVGEIGQWQLTIQ